MDAEEWTALFDRAADCEVGEADVAAALAEIRDSRAGERDPDGAETGDGTAGEAGIDE